MHPRRTFTKHLAKLTAAVAFQRLLPRSNVYGQGYGLTKDRLIRRSVRPPDYETPVELLETWITPNELFYVRSHLYTPDVRVKEWSLSIDGEVLRPFSVGLEALKTFPAMTGTVTLEGAGNGRRFFEPPVAGIQWGRGAVGTARWKGVRLADLLKKAGVKATGKFVMLDGIDQPIGSVENSFQ